MDDVVRVFGLRPVVRIGHTDEERQRLQELVLDLEIALSDRKAARSDSIADTVDYAEASRAAVAALAGREYRLLESAAEAAADAVLTMGARRVLVRLRKLAPAGLGADASEIEIRRP